MRSPLEVRGPGPRVLVIAGHDPTGGAGVLADADALRSAGASGTLVVTAWTDQDDLEVRSLGARPPAEWLAEVEEALLRPPAAIKLGLLPGPEHVEAVAQWLAALPKRPPVVVDPVLAASSGGRLVAPGAPRAFVERLLPLGCCWTPNLSELAELAGVPFPAGEDERLAAAARLVAAGARAVVAKGGHGAEDPVRELVLEGDRAQWLEHPRRAGAGLRGSGCRHASTLAAGLARGLDLVRAAREAADHVRLRLQGP